MMKKTLVGKKIREPTFKENEKLLLIEIVEDHLDIVECKRTDAISSKLKFEEWQKIAIEFNSLKNTLPSNYSYIERDALALKTLWENLKKRAKLAITSINTNKYATGGGPMNIIKNDSITDKIIPLIKNRVEGFNNKYDSDNISSCTGTESSGTSLFSAEQKIPIKSPEQSSAITVKQSYTNQVSAPFSSMASINGNWESYSPGLLRTPRAKVLLNIDQEAVEEESTASDPIPSGSPEAGVRKKQRFSNTPSAIKSTRHLNNRRWPVVRDSESVALAATKIKTLHSSVEQAKREHEVTMRCLLLKEEQEKEKLEQEKEKLRQEQEKTEQEIIKKKILLAELERVTKSSESQSQIK